ncbi:MAG: TonB-dependent receptor, partial [Rubrivivax sp.]
NYYGLASDYNKGSATYGTLSHTHRFGGNRELKTVVRHGRYERDLWASVISKGVGVPANATTTDYYDDPNLVLQRTGKGRVGETDVTYLGTTYTGAATVGSLKHNLVLGAEWMQEDAKRNTNAAGGSGRATTTVGTPNDGATFADTRGSIRFNTFDAKTFSLYGQDTIELTSTLKVLAGLRYDHFKYDYENITVGTPGSYDRTDKLWTRRFGLIYQPSDWASYHVSYGTSFNTSGDTYSLSAANENIAPEKSRNIEVGTKLDLLDNRLFVGASLFHTTKYRERNTDPDVPSIVLLSGKRHALGLDFDVAGRITPNWEAFVSYTWIPKAEIDESTTRLAASGTGSQVEGDRPALTPKHSASLWTTYRVLPALRVGGGLNYRSEQSPERQRLVKSDAFTTLDLMAEYTINQNLAVKFNVKNATNELYADSLYASFYVPGAPRTYQVSLKAKF